MPKGYVYILKSLKDDRHYIGHTSDLSKRLISHNDGSNKSTKSRRGLSLIYSEQTQNISEAVKKEKRIKDLGVVRFLRSM